MEPKKAFTRFTRLLIEVTRTSYFGTSNEFEHVRLLYTLFLASNDLTSNFEHIVTHHYLILLRLVEDMASK